MTHTPHKCLRKCSWQALNCPAPTDLLDSVEAEHLVLVHANQGHAVQRLHRRPGQHVLEACDAPL